MAKIKHSLIEIPAKPDFKAIKLPMIELKSDKKGPVLWLTACSHGDEVGGIIVVQEIFNMLKRYKLKRGRVCAFPLTNPIGFESTKISRDVVTTSEDLNRAFPGKKEGRVIERIAERIFSTIIKSKPSLVLDLHNDWRKSIPYALIDTLIKNKEIEKKIKLYAEKTNFLIIKEQEEDLHSGNLDKTLSYSLIQKNIPAITLELGESYVVNEKNVEDGVRAIWNVMSLLGMVEEKIENFNYKIPAQLTGKTLKYSQQNASSILGIIRFLASPGTIVKKGQIIARIYNPFGDILEEVKAKNNAIVIGYADSSVAIKDAPIMAFGII